MVTRGDYGCLEVKIHMYTEHQSSPEVSRDDFKCLAVNAGAYAAFSAGGGCTLSLIGPHVSSPKNIYLCTIREVHPFLLRKETSFCVREIRNIIVSITDWK